MNVVAASDLGGYDARWATDCLPPELPHQHLTSRRSVPRTGAAVRRNKLVTTHEGSRVVLESKA